MGSDVKKARSLMDHHLGAVQERALINRTQIGDQRLNAVLANYANVVQVERRGR